MAKSETRKFFEFVPAVLDEIGQRQNFRCAVCGTNLGRGNTKILVNYHHVVPVQSGNPANRSHDFIRSADNGVLLCDESAAKSRSESCHGLVAHGESRFGTFAAYADAFPYSHGGDKEAHRSWVRSLNDRSRAVYTPG
ncbi:MAG: HNH endonuclease [Planctomycetota bacterium]